MDSFVDEINKLFDRRKKLAKEVYILSQAEWDDPEWETKIIQSQEKLKEEIDLTNQIMKMIHDRLNELQPRSSIG